MASTSHARTHLSQWLHNESILRMGLNRMHMSLALGRFQANKLTYVAAGMPPPFVFRAATQEVDEIPTEGLPLGSKTNFPYRPASTSLSRGDAVLFMTDGFPELANPSGALGYKGARSLFHRACEGAAQSVIENLHRAVRDWADGSRPGDDVTFVVVKAL